MLSAQSVACPYCGERFEAGVDASAGAQSYVEDCPICCHPIVFSTFIDAEGRPTGVEVKREDD